MTIENIDITATLERVKKQMEEDAEMRASTRSMIELLVLIITLLLNRLGLNSRNSSKPPSSDPNRKKSSRQKTGKKPGGQAGHKGSTLTKVDDPDFIETLMVDKRTLPKGNYRPVGYESRQVFDLHISRVVTEFRAEVLEDEDGHRFIAEFPGGNNPACTVWSGAESSCCLYVAIPACAI